MTPLAWLYSSVVGLRNTMFDRELLRARKLAWPVVSIGNISVGGSGKTPFVVMLGELLALRGVWIDVLSRGYRRSTHGVLTVNAQGAAEQYGDEPLLITRRLHCPVIVGEDRFQAGLEAEADFAGAGPNPMHLLDDGFQHRQLHRDFDIVLLNQEDLEDKLLPSGRLREPLSSLKRADVAVVESSFPAERIPKGDFGLWRVERQLEAPEINSPLVAFCGIARPQRFFSDLRRKGIDVREEIVFPDHHRYTEGDVQRLSAAQARFPASRLITTEKDQINLGSYLAALDPIVAKMRMRLADPEAGLKFMFSTIAERRACR